MSSVNFMGYRLHPSSITNTQVFFYSLNKIHFESRMVFPEYLI